MRFCDSETILRHLPKLDGFKPRGDGVLFIGSEGWLHNSRSAWQASSRAMRKPWDVLNPKYMG